MKVIIIAFVILFTIDRIWTNYIKYNIKANIKYHAEGNLLYSLIVIAEWILGVIIIVKIILKLLGE